MRIQRSSLLVVFVLLNFFLCGQTINRLVILADGDSNSPTVRLEIETLEAEFRNFFQTKDVQILHVSDAPEKQPDAVLLTMEDALRRMQELCLDPGQIVALVFIFSEGKGPLPNELARTLELTRSEVKILSNAYFRNSLSDLTCSRYAVFNYTRGLVQSKDTIVEEEHGFPIIPVVAGAALIPAGILIFSGDKTECVTVNPAWQLPTGLCSDGAPVQLVVTGTLGGTWSGTGVTSGGIFDPTSGTQAVTYTVGEGSCRQSRAQTINVVTINAGWSIPSTPCAGETITLIPVSTGGTWQGSGVSQNQNGTADFTQANAGIYEVTYSLTIGSCNAQETKTITVLPDADPSWTTPGTICAGASIQLIPTGTQGGLWSGESVTDMGNGTAVFTPSSPGAYNITYSAGTGECAQSLAQSVDVLPNPDASWSPPSSPPCSGEVVTLMTLSMTSGIWSGPGITDHGDGTASFTQFNAGTYTIIFTAIAGQCSTSVTHDIIVIDQSDPSWIVPPDLCTGTSYTLSPNGTPGGTWNGQGVTDLGNGMATFIVQEAGNYAITYTAGTGACEAALTHELIVMQTPDASWSLPPNALCPGDSYELMPTGSTGGIWAGPGVIDHGNGTASFMQTEAGEYMITYTVMNGPCIASSSQTLIVVSNPDASWIPPTDVCSGSEILLVPTGTMGGTWTGTQITDLGNGNAQFNPLESGSYPVTYTIGQANCMASLTLNIDVLASPDASWTPPIDVCTGLVILLEPQGTMGGTWTGQGITDLGNGTAQFSQNKSGVYTVTYSVTMGPCVSSLEQSIEVTSLPDPAWTPPDDVCTGQEVQLIPDGTQGGVWSGTGVIDQGNGTALFLQEVDGEYAVTYTVGQGPCAQSLSQEIVVLHAGDPSWIPPSDVICPGAIVELNTLEGTWSGVGVTDLGGGLGQFQANEQGTYTITLTVGTGNCSASESHDVEVGDFDPPLIEVPASDMVVTCDGNGNVVDLQDWLDNNGGAEAIDGCGTVVLWDNDFFDFPFECGMSGAVSVIFTATDDAGNTATTIGVFTIEDQAPPIFEGVPPDIVVPCEAIPPPAQVSAFDICSGDADVVFEELPPGSGCPYEIIRIWTATDACGNETSVQQVIEANDTQPPEPQSLPHDTLIHCIGPPEQCIPPPEEVLFIDNCDTDPTVTLEEQIQIIPQGLIVIRCWTATDDCLNMSAPVCQNIIIMSNAPDGNELQTQIFLSLNSNGAPEEEEFVLDFFDPALVQWEDPGIVYSLSPYPFHAFTVVSTPRLSFEMEIPLSTGVNIFAGTSRIKAELYRHYGDPDQTILSGSLKQRLFQLGLRFIPKHADHLYFLTGWSYSDNRYSDFRMNTTGGVVRAKDKLHTFALFPLAGIGTKFSLGDYGTWEIHARYGTSETATVMSELKITLSSVIDALRKRRQ